MRLNKTEQEKKLSKFRDSTGRYIHKMDELLETSVFKKDKQLIDAYLKAKKEVEELAYLLSAKGY